MVDYSQIEREQLIALVNRAIDGDREAFGQLYTSHERFVFGVALRVTRSYSRAQEITQDTFIQAMRMLPRLREPAAFTSWIRVIAHRLSLNNIRAQHKTVELDDAVVANSRAVSRELIERTTPLDEAIASERRQAVRREIRALSRLDRNTLRTRYFKGRSLEEMAGNHTALGTIKRRLHVARHRLGARLESVA